MPCFIISVNSDIQEYSTLFSFISCFYFIVTKRLKLVVLYIIYLYNNQEKYSR